jgi:hypothetical protein
VFTAVVPLLYASAMAAGAVAALLTGLAYDRSGRGVLLALPAIIAAVPPLAFGARPDGGRSRASYSGPPRSACRTPQL